jgi:cytochrome c553
MHVMRTTICALASILALPLAFAGDTTPLENKLRECAGCHGTDGNSISPTIPNLAGQKEEYLKQTLTAYRDSEREGASAAMMTPMAAGLTDAEIADLAKHFSSLN